MGQSSQHTGCPYTPPWAMAQLAPGVCPGTMYGGYLTHCRHFKDTVSWAIPAKMAPTHSSQAVCVRIVVAQSSAKAQLGVVCGVFSGMIPCPSQDTTLLVELRSGLQHRYHRASSPIPTANPSHTHTHNHRARCECSRAPFRTQVSGGAVCGDSFMRTNTPRSGNLETRVRHHKQCFLSMGTHKSGAERDK